MKSKKEIDEVDEILPEYDFSKGVTGKYYERYRQGTNVVLLDLDVAEFYPDAESVNKVLRTVAELAKLTNIGK